VEAALQQALRTFIATHFADFVKDEEGRDRQFYVSFYNLESVEGCVRPPAGTRLLCRSVRAVACARSAFAT
jgi:hypothetical protein